MKAYIEIRNSFCTWRRELNESDLRNIGEFTEENILSWLNTTKSFPVRYRGGDQDPSDFQQFHSVCGDSDIRWKTENPVHVYPSSNPLTKWEEEICRCGHSRKVHRLTSRPDDYSELCAECGCEAFYKAGGRR